MPYLSANSRQNVHSLDDYVRDIVRNRGSELPVLKSTTYKIEIRSGLAFVTLNRKFENNEKKPIEAVMTFPVPFQAVVTNISTEIDGRKLVGVAQAKLKARETYENAIDSGKAAILHEQLLQGLHMVSVANVKPGTHIDVCAEFVVPLSIHEESGRLRIPLTVGQLYGDLPLKNAEALVMNGPKQSADVSVHCENMCLLNGKPVISENISVSLDYVINIEVPNISLYSLTDVAKDGRRVKLEFSPSAAEDRAMEFDLLLDSSWSMNDPDETGSRKWDAMISALTRVDELGLREDDKINLWTFSNDVTFECSTTKKNLARAVANIVFVKGGTELDHALKTVSASKEGANILVVTDGRAGHLDHDELARNGLRVTAVLMGTDALEATIGTLAAHTGGQMFVTFGRDTARDMAAAIRSMRTVPEPVSVTEKRPSELVRSVGGLLVSASWSASRKKTNQVPGVSAYAAYLALSSMPSDKAAIFAAEEGLVSHLTSIVLVDDAGEAVDGIPAQRKVPLSASWAGSAAQAQPSLMVRSLAFASPMDKSYDSAALSSPGALSAFHSAVVPSPAGGRGYVKPSRANDILVGAPIMTPFNPETPEFMDFDALKELGDIVKSIQGDTVSVPSDWRLKSSMSAFPIDWDDLVDMMLKGDIEHLPLSVRARIKAISVDAKVKALAIENARDPEIIAIGLMAYVDRENSRTADRIQRRHLKNIGAGVIEGLIAQL